MKTQNEKAILTCPCCKFTCTAMQNLRIHFQQTNHKPHGRKFKNKSGFPAPAVHKMDQENPGTLAENIRRSLQTLKDYMDMEEREPLIGLECILEYRLWSSSNNRVELRYYCDVCVLDCAVVSMVEHLIGMRHIKLYLTKEYPYVLKAPSISREDRPQFLKRMAIEIEKEEGTQMYQSDPVVRNISIMNVKASEAKQSKRKSRWDIEGSKESRMKKALEYLESFEIENSTEASTVVRLTDKLTAELRLYSNKLNEEALYPVRLARAKDVAKALASNTALGKKAQKKPVQKNPPLNSGPPAAPSGDKLGAPIILPSIPNNDNLNWARTPNAPLPQRPQQPPFIPPNLNPHGGSGFFPQRPPPPFFPGNPYPNFQGMPGAFPQMPPPMLNFAANQTQPLQQAEPAKSNSEDEDIKFFKKLMALLSVLPQNTTSSDNSNLGSKLTTLKSLFMDKTPDKDNLAGNQQSSSQVASLTQDKTTAENGSLNQQLMMMMASRNNANMTQLNQNLMMQMASMSQNVMPMAGTMPASTNSFLPNSQGFQNQGFGLNDKNLMIMNQSFQNTYMEPQIAYSATSQNFGGFGNDKVMSESYVSMSQYSKDAQFMVQTSNPIQNVRPDESGMYSGEQSYSTTSKVEGCAPTQTPYTRVSLSPIASGIEKKSLQNPSSDLDLRKEINSQDVGPSVGKRSSSSYNDPARTDGEITEPYGKRIKFDTDRRTENTAHNSEESDSVQLNLENLSADLLKVIRGKDLFTVSAILSEYADNRPSK